jgi:hypothetical protein
MKQSIGALLILSAASLLTACNGNNGINTPPGTGTNCGGPPASNQLEVLYPIPNSKNAPQNLSNIFVSTKGQLPPNNQFNFFLVQSNAKSTFTSLFFRANASQIPSPHKNPTYSNPTYYASSLLASWIIGPKQAVSLFWNDGGTGCTPHFLVSSFTTQ